MKLNKIRIQINIISTILAQASSLLVPIFLAPNLAVNIGAQAASIILLSLTVTQFLLVITDYGFGITGVRRLAVIKIPSLKASILISKIYTLKMVLIVFSIIPFGIYLKVAENLDGYRWLFFWMFVSSAVISYQSPWYFQAIQKIFKYNLLIIISRVFYVIIIFTVLDKLEDVWIAGLFYFLINLVSAIIILQGVKFRFVMPKYKYIYKELHNSFEFFLSRLAASSYAILGGIFLSITSNPKELSIFVFSEIIYKTGVALIYPVTQVIFPIMAKSKDIKEFNKYAFRVSMFAVLTSILLLCTADGILLYTLGDSYIGASTVTMIFSVAVGISICSVFLGYPFLVTINRLDLANKSVIYASLIQVIIFWILYFFDASSAINVAMGILLVETFVLLFRAIIYFRYK